MKSYPPCKQLGTLSEEPYKQRDGKITSRGGSKFLFAEAVVGSHIPYIHTGMHAMHASNLASHQRVCMSEQRDEKVTSGGESKFLFSEHYRVVDIWLTQSIHAYIHFKSQDGGPKIWLQLWNLLAAGTKRHSSGMRITAKISSQRKIELVKNRCLFWPFFQLPFQSI